MDNEVLNSFRDYIKEISQALKAKDATEHTHRPALKTLIEGLSKGITATNEPKHMKGIAPDFVVKEGARIIGYIETKDVGKNLDDVEKTEQIKRYRKGLSNLIITNYLEFRWYVDGEIRLTENLGLLAADGKIKHDTAGIEKTAELINGFLKHEAKDIGTPKDLATRMADLAHIIRNSIIKTFASEAETGSLHSQMAAFRDNLIPDLSVEQFADMYAQTIAYGLFAAKCMIPYKKDFTRFDAGQNLPKTNPFLRKLFQEIAGLDLDTRIAWAVDDLAQVLAQADIGAVREGFSKRTGKEDTVVHFYETFLKEYAPGVREMRGVYYTPEPVVSYIVRSIDYLLKTRFSKPRGLADENTLILDPAAGTATFLYMVINEINKAFAGQEGTWNDYVAEKLLKRIFGFELLMAPYAIAHLKLGLQLEDTGYKFQSDQRIQVYMTNTLDEALKHTENVFANWINEEANTAADIKKEKPIMVVLGNPPYSGHSANASTKQENIKAGENYWKKIDGKWEWVQSKNNLVAIVPTFIGKLIEDYYFVDGKPLREKNSKWLQDDYVKFIRFGQWRIERTGKGILGFITNHSYLDNPTFRGMRQSLMKTFNDIYILNLHGNSKKKEVTPEGGKDENVFDIKQGVAICLMIKEQGKPIPGEVHYADLWGLREGKNKTLHETDINNTDWSKLNPKSPFYFFVPRDEAQVEEYDKGRRITDIFTINNVGLYTGRDKLTIQWSFKEIKDVINSLIRLSPDDFLSKYDSDIGDILLAQKDVRNSGLKHELFSQISYRPFDIRYTFYTGHSNGFYNRPRYEIMRHMLNRNNLAMILNKQIMAGEVRHTWLTRSLTDLHIIETAHASAYLFPLYLYPAEGEMQFEGGKRRPNLNPEFIKESSTKLGLEFVEDGKGDLEKTYGPEDIFNYAYAVFHSPTYRTRYAEFLKIDFPRLPLTSNKALFKKLEEKGAELVSLHLMESAILNNLITKYPVTGDNKVEKVIYNEKERRVYINKTQYFEGVPPEVWNFHVGGYQVCEKWLKDRKGRTLSYDDLTHYQKIVVALKETIRLMAEIDKAIPSWSIS